MTQRNPRIRALLTESLVIVLSILAAFALDAYWGRRLEREAELSYLEALRSDFTETAARIAETVANEERAATLAGRLLAGDQGTSSEELDQMLFDLWALPTLEPVAGAMDEIISSGQLRIIRDDQLRAALAAWPADVEHYRRRESWAQDNWNYLIAPFIMRELSLGQLASGLLGEIPGEAAPLDHSHLMRDRYFRNLVIHRWITTDDVLTALRRLQARDEEILGLLSGALSP